MLPPGRVLCDASGDSRLLRPREREHRDDRTTTPSGGHSADSPDRGGWQREAARELAAILDDHPDLPAITWTISRTGGITGGIDTLALAPEVRTTFTAWQQALGLRDVAEDDPDNGGRVTWLRARGERGGVRVSVQAHLFTEDPPTEPGKRPVQRDVPRPAAAPPRDLRPPEPVRDPGQAPDGPRL